MLPLQALLLRTGRVSIEQLAEAIRENVETGRSIEDVVVSRGWISAEEVADLRPRQAEEVALTPTPAPAPTPVPVGAAEDSSASVFLNIENGERLRIANFASEPEAQQHAQELVDALVRPEPGVWPRFGRRLVRPEAVVSVQVERRHD